MSDKRSYGAHRSCEYRTVVGDAEQERSNSSAMSDKTVLMIRSVEDSLAHLETERARF